jgi:hypothetical protein
MPEPAAAASTPTTSSADATARPADAASTREKPPGVTAPELP